MTTKRISIALCTYNGASLLHRQLESIANQTLPPDELVVCDDASTDETPQILSSFQAVAPFPVRLHVNRTNCGSTANFEQAINLCQGDLIALADQDDAWLPHKLEAIEQRFAAFPEIGAVFSDAVVVDEEWHPLGYTLWQHVGFSPARQEMVDEGQSLEALLKHLVVTGATLAFRSQLREVISPIPPLWIHDAWIALLIAGGPGLKAIPEPLILYRQHGGNQIGARQPSLAERFHEALSLDRNTYYGGELARYEAARARLKKFPRHLRPDTLSLLDAKIAHLQHRSALPNNRLLRLPFVLVELIKGGYHRYSYGWEVAVKDLLLRPQEPRTTKP